MNRFWRILHGAVPSPRNEWIRAHYAELEHIEGRGSRMRWTLGSIPVAISALVGQLRHDPGSFLGGLLFRTVVATLSVLALAAGVALVMMYVAQTSSPLIVPALGGTLFIQGGFALALLLGAFGSRRALALRLELIASKLAALVGALGFVVAFIGNIDPAGNDHEYGPITIAVLIAAHGIAAIIAFSTPPSSRAETSTS